MAVRWPGPKETTRTNSEPESGHPVRARCTVSKSRIAPFPSVGRKSGETMRPVRNQSSPVTAILRVPFWSWPSASPLNVRQSKFFGARGHLVAPSNGVSRSFPRMRLRSLPVQQPVRAVFDLAGKAPAITASPSRSSLACGTGHLGGGARFFPGNGLRGFGTRVTGSG